MNAPDGWAAVGACLTRAEAAVKAHRMAEAGEALCAMLLEIERHFGEFSRGERGATLLGKTLESVIRCALSAGDCPGMPEAYAQAVQGDLLVGDFG